MKKEQITPEIAELAGIFAADGNLQQTHISFWGHIIDDREYYDNHMTRLFEESFAFSPRPHAKAPNSVYGFYVCTPHIIQFFHEVLEFEYGKKTYTVRAPSAVMHSQEPDVWAAFVRGYADGDGSLSFSQAAGKGVRPYRKVLHVVPRIQITSVSEGVIDDISELLKRFSIRHTVRRAEPPSENEHTRWTICVTGKHMLERWMQRIGFTNPSKNSRYEIYLRHGYVPPRTTYPQRKEILLGMLCPLELYNQAP